MARGDMKNLIVQQYGKIIITYSIINVKNFNKLLEKGKFYSYAYGVKCHATKTHDNDDDDSRFLMDFYGL